MNEETCDFCDARFPYGERRAAAVSRPSDPSELVAVMWGCGSCKGSAKLPRATDLIDAVEAGEPVGGRRYLFVSV